MITLSQLRRIRGHALWITPLDAQSVIVDAGAHAGQFSQIVHDMCGGRCVLIEANPVLAGRLAAPPGGEVVHAALGAVDGEASFVFRENPEGGSINSRSFDVHYPTTPVEVISLGTLRRRFNLNRIDVLKLDVEGAEFALLDQTPDHILSDIRQVTVEFHDFVPEFQGQRFYELARARLESLGFICANFAFRTHGDVLFVNSRHLHLTFLDRFFVQHIAKWLVKLRSA
ncbi:MAG: FkbM family methyltransferase [Prosthecobacter sp.]|uniref:FkbM family methyltransferase n=1 Tax=Prosthecobacter sp. TaxID=1965333 RepID=UPI001A02B774|nr:FkbM family methyltransferase [Prosthecobacter sp.]MBE2286887.1 FkbM family methyltransferase [Prosthecobacter sp.]